MLRVIFAFSLITFFTSSILGQDANYWTSSYGPGGFFTPGAIIANNGDSGTLFYNPALLAYNKQNAASITGTIYRWEGIKINDGTGVGLHLKSGSALIIPLIASHIIKLNTKKPFSLVYAIVNTPIINYQSSQRKDEIQNVLDDSYSPGPETFIGEYASYNTVNETSLILSGGYKVSEKLAIGLSMEGQVHKQNFQQQLKSIAVQNSGGTNLFPPITSTSEFYQVTYNSTGLKFKAGLSYDINANNHFGLLVTTPLIHLYGKATLLSDIQINNLKIGNTVDVNFLASTRQTKLNANWKMPLSIAAGYTHDYEKGQIYFATEYFSSLKEYNVVNARNEAFIRPDTGTRQTSTILKFKDARQAVYNFALGLSFNVKPYLTTYISLRTDFTYTAKSLFSSNDGFATNTASWDDYHAQLGINLRKRNTMFVQVFYLLMEVQKNIYSQQISIAQMNQIF